MLRSLRMREVAEILDISVPRAYALAREGLLPVVRLGRQLRVDAEVFHDFLRAGGRSLPGGWRREPPLAASSTMRTHDREPRE